MYIKIVKVGSSELSLFLDGKLNVVLMLLNSFSGNISKCVLKIMSKHGDNESEKAKSQ